MGAIAMGVLWWGYTMTFWGYCKIKGYDITLTQIAIPGKYTGAWPPPVGSSSATSAPAAGSTAPTSTGSSAGMTAV